MESKRQKTSKIRAQKDKKQKKQRIEKSKKKQQGIKERPQKNEDRGIGKEKNFIS